VRAHAARPGEHYDRVTNAWKLLLGENLHYGVFDDDATDIASATDELTRLMTVACRIVRQVSVLDVGCGTGAPACDLARRFGARVTGITTSAVGVDAARARAEREHVANLVTFEQRDGMDNGFPDASFDRVWALESSHLMRSREAFVAECARVLRPSGWFAVCDIVLRRPLPFADVRRLRAPLALLREVFGDARMEQLETYVELAQAHGLTVDEMQDLTSRTRPTFARWRENAVRMEESVRADLGEEAFTQFLESCTILEGLWDDGTLGYGLLAAHKD
jgi:cyclopropane fatty-acyl-phospholipid synthase-like methyltransferase